MADQSNPAKESQAVTAARAFLADPWKEKLNASRYKSTITREETRQPSEGNRLAAPPEALDRPVTPRAPKRFFQR
jgi:hypothetical protein